MSITAKVSGLDSLEAKLRALPPTVRDGFLAAQDRAADDFVDKVKSIVPERTGALRDSIEKSATDRGGVKVSAGNATAYYAAFVEFGHMTKGGRHVRAQPFFFTSWRLNRKRYARNIKAAGSRAIKKLLVSGGL